MNIDAAFLTALSGFILAVMGIIVSLVTQRNAATKSQMEATQAELNSLRATIKTLQDQNELLTDRLDRYVKENGALREWAEGLVCQVEELGGKPVRFRAEDTRPRG